MADIVHIEGTWGELRVDRNTGVIIDYNDYDKRGWDPGDVGYHEIMRFDPVTLRAHSHYDILATGYWTHAGDYAVPLTVRLMVDPKYPGMDFDEWVPAASLEDLRT